MEQEAMEDLRRKQASLRRAMEEAQQKAWEEEEVTVRERREADMREREEALAKAKAIRRVQGEQEFQGTMDVGLFLSC